MSRRLITGLGSAVLALVAVGLDSAVACPFCNAVSQTLSEEIASMDAAVITRLIKAPDVAPGSSAADEIPKAEFEIVQVIKGATVLGNTKRIQALCFGDVKVGDRFLVMGVDPPKIAWSTPMRVSERAVAYLLQLPGLPEKGPDRLAFFQNYFEDEDDLLARDAYDEFARAPYSDVQSLKDKIDHDQILAWIKDLDVPISHRRLYLVLLSVCGGDDDLPLLEQMLRSEDRKQRAGLDAMLGCYLMLAGPDGMPLVEELFLKNNEAEYADTYAAIMALRFHGTETDVIPRPRILQGFRYMLERPQLADLVIPDLARWEDWSQVDRMVRLFKEADEKASWVRVPVINYLRACPKPEADKYIKELEKIDPEAVKRANTFFPFGGGVSSPVGDDSSSVQEPSTERFVSREQPEDDLAQTAGSSSGKVALTSPQAFPEEGRQRDDRPVEGMNTFRVLGVLCVAGGLFTASVWTLLGRNRSASRSSG
jgi:hypothetical protein